MNYSKKIESSQNSLVKKIKALQKSRVRKEQQQFLIEGELELVKAIKAGIEIECFFICEALLSGSLRKEILGLEKVERIEVSQNVFDAIAYRESSGGVVALAKHFNTDFLDKKLPKNPLVLILDSLEKPGNLGAILRTADAVGIDLIILSDPVVEIFNPNVIRASIGCVFVVPIVQAKAAEVKEWCLNNGINIVASYLATTSSLYDCDFLEPTAIVMGAEATGINDFWLEQSNQQIKIPMNGETDSLNVSTATAVILYEAFRQRK